MRKFLRLRNGFSLAELLLVIGITGIIAAATYVALPHGLRSVNTLDIAANELASRLQDARIKASAQEEGSKWGLHLDAVNGAADTYIVFYGDNYVGGTLAATVTLPAVVQFTDPAQGGTKDIIFSKITGYPDAAATIILSLTNDPETVRTITVSGVGVVSVSKNQPFDFGISANPGSGSVQAGDPIQSTITAALISGTASSVSFSASGLPSGAGVSFNPTNCNPTCASTMTITTQVSTPPGTYPITVTGTAGNVVKNTIYTLTVNMVPFDFSISANPSSGSVKAGNSIQLTITATQLSGDAELITFSASNLPADAIVDFVPPSCAPSIGSCESTMTITTQISTPAGTYPITVTGTAGGTVRNTDYSLTISPPYGNIWLPKGPSLSWRNVAMSNNGVIQTAVGGGQIYVSTDSGDTWTLKYSGSMPWRNVAMSGTGQIQTAVAATGQIYVSTDSGNTWTLKYSGGGGWFSVAMADNGVIQTAAVYNGQIYVSTDSGDTWTPKDSNRYWYYGLAMSSDGQIQTAGVYNGQIYVSTDSGDTWTPKDSNRWWSGVAMSDNGVIQTAAVNTGKIYVSTDSGNTWTPKDSNRSWYDIAVSGNGLIQTAVAQNGQIYVSNDFGSIWTPKDSNRNWSSVAMSSSGQIQATTVFNEQIYVSEE